MLVEHIFGNLDEGKKKKPESDLPKTRNFVAKNECPNLVQVRTWIRKEKKHHVNVKSVIGKKICYRT